MLDPDVLPPSWLELSEVSLMLFVFEILCQSSQIQFDENHREMTTVRVSPLMCLPLHQISSDFKEMVHLINAFKSQ